MKEIDINNLNKPNVKVKVAEKLNEAQVDITATSKQPANLEGK